jgi:hypothetical protein
MENPFDLWLKQNGIRHAWAAAALRVPQSTIFEWARPDYWPPNRRTMQRIFTFTGGEVSAAHFFSHETSSHADAEAGALLLQTIKEFKNAERTQDKRAARNKLRNPETPRPAARIRKKGAGAVA